MAVIMGILKEGEGLRQGDPMSPLLFVLVMEYLTRTLQTMSLLTDFRFHPRCKEQRLTYLLFTDDLMIFCKGTVASVNRVVETLKHFSVVTGLEANLEKSSVFLAGVEDNIRDQILAMTVVSMGKLPIRYLGLPLSPRKWRKMDCHAL